MKNYNFLITFLIALSSSLSAQNFSGGFNFYLPPKDTSRSAFLPWFPAKAITDQDFISINSEGHFSVQGKPIRFFGANFIQNAAFPTKTKAWYIAGRYRKMGFNLVRLHQIDCDPWAFKSLFEANSDTRHLNPVTLDILDNLISEFKKNGIYVDMNLHVYRKITKNDGVKNWDSLPTTMVNYFDPQILSLHKEYARQLLTHVNPYTGKALCNDPVMAWVEVTNENSLYRGWQENSLKTKANGGILPYRHVLMLDSLWIAYLKKKYPTTDSLKSAWSVGTYIDQNSEMLQDGGFENQNQISWVLQKMGTASATLEFDSISPHEGNYAAKLLVNQTNDTVWNLQFKQTGMSIMKDSVYQISFWARADSIRSISVDIDNATGTYKWYGGKNFSLDREWKQYLISFRAPESNANNVRLAFNIGYQKGIYLIDNVSFNSNIQGLLIGESIESNTIRRIDYSECLGFSNQRVKDLSSFYLQLEVDYFSAMKSFLKDSLGVKVPIVGTNWNKGLADRAGMSSMDIMDNHKYWDHPSFPPDSFWISHNWHINNDAMVKSADCGTIPLLMDGTAMVNKPYTISEYNHIFPNKYQTEGPLFITGYSSFQDIDGFIFNDYFSTSSDDWETDKIGSYFSIHRNTALMSLMPSCAMAYRMGMIKKYQKLIAIDYQKDSYLLFPKSNAAYGEEVSLYPQKLSLVNGLRTSSYVADKTTDFTKFPANPVSPYISDTKELVWDTNGLFTISAPGFHAATGFFNLFSNHSFGAMTLVSGNDFGTLTWISLDADSLQTARKSLLTVSSRIQNSNIIWDGIHTIHNNWGNAPTQMHPHTIELKLHINAKYIVVYPLDSCGNIGSSGKTYYPSSPNMFAVSIDQNTDKTVWYGIEANGDTTLSIAGGVHVFPKNFNLQQNYPNPFSISTTFSFELPESAFVSLKVFDLTGRNVAIIVSEKLSAGNYSRQWSAENMPQGIYYYRLEAGTFIRTKKLVLQVCK